MPNAHDYRDAADRFRRLAADLTHESEQWAFDPADLAGGPVQSSLETSLAARRHHLGRAGDELSRLAGVCDHRADVCADYARAVWRHSQLGWQERWQTTPPVRPATWVEL